MPLVYSNHKPMSIEIPPLEIKKWGSGGATLPPEAFFLHYKNNQKTGSSPPCPPFFIGR